MGDSGTEDDEALEAAMKDFDARAEARKKAVAAMESEEEEEEANSDDSYLDRNGNPRPGRDSGRRHTPPRAAKAKATTAGDETPVKKPGPKRKALADKDKAKQKAADQAKKKKPAAPAVNPPRKRLPTQKDKGKGRGKRKQPEPDPDEDSDDSIPDGDKKPAAKKSIGRPPGGKTFIPIEDIWLCTAYVSSTLDPIAGANQSSKQYWEQVVKKRFDKLKQDAIDNGDENIPNGHTFPERDGGSLEGRYKRTIQLFCTQFMKFYRTSWKKERTGNQPESIILDEAMEEWFEEKKKPFGFAHCLPTLSQLVAFRPSLSHKERNTIDMLDDDDDEETNNNDQPMGAGKKRPVGTKKAKKKKAEEEASAAASASTASLEERRVASLERMSHAHVGMQKNSAISNDLKTRSILLQEIKALTNEAALFQSLGMLDAARGAMIQVAAKRGLLAEPPAPAAAPAPTAAVPAAVAVPQQAPAEEAMPLLNGQVNDSGIELTEEEKEEVEEGHIV